MARREKHRERELAARARSAGGLDPRPTPARSVREVVAHPPGSLGFMVLEGLQQVAHVYQGTADPVVVAERRARNKRARAARRRHQRRARA